MIQSNFTARQLFRFIVFVCSQINFEWVFFPPPVRFTFVIFFHFCGGDELSVCGCARSCSLSLTGTKMIMDLPMDATRINWRACNWITENNVAKFNRGSVGTVSSDRQFDFGVHEVQIDIMPYGCMCYANASQSHTKPNWFTYRFVCLFFNTRTARFRNELSFRLIAICLTSSPIDDSDIKWGVTRLDQRLT